MANQASVPSVFMPEAAPFAFDMMPMACSMRDSMNDDTGNAMPMPMMMPAMGFGSTAHADEGNS
ncbi:MAG: hypothetical protein ACR2OW_12620 [Methyloligellaceae bacterium]